MNGSDNKSSTWRRSVPRGPFTTKWWRTRGKSAASWMSVLCKQTPPVVATWPCTTALISPSKFTCRAIPCSPAPYTFSLLASVEFLGCAVRGFHGKWTSLLMKPTVLEKARTVSCRTCTTFLRVLASVRPLSTSIATTVPGKTRISLCFGTSHGEWSLVSTRSSLSISWSRDTQSSCQTAALGF